MSKPTNKPGWNPTTNSTEPSSAKKAAGWSSGEKPSSAHFNWLMKTVSEWIDHIDAEGVQGPKGDTGPQGPQGEKGDTGPAGASGGISSADLARISALEGVSGIVAASPVTVTFPYNGGAAPSEYTIGNSGSSIAVNWANGASQFVTLTADATVSFTGATAGNTYYLRIQQGGYGLKRVVGWPTNIVWNGGSVPTISTAAWTVDVIGCYYDGTNYYGYVSQGYFTAPSVIDTKNGYIAGGMSGNGSGLATAVSTVEKINFNSDTTLSIVQSEYGKLLNSSGSYIYPTTSIYNFCLGTQSSTDGYRTAFYSSLPTVNNQSSCAVTKLSFASDTGALSHLRPLSTSNWYNSNRRAVYQSASNAYMHTSNSAIAKLAFSNDSFSNLAVSGIAYNGLNYSVGFSTASTGIFWGVVVSILTGYKTSFSTETVYTLVTYNSYISDAGGWSEGVDAEYNGYFVKTTTNTPTTTCYKVDKVIDTWNTLSTTLAQNSTCASATQGNSAGYFCGGQISGLSSPSYYNVGISNIKKILYSPETFSAHSASLAAARNCAAGFEG